MIQDPEGGGIADRPGDMVDVFHTQFGVAGKLRVACEIVRALTTASQDYLCWDTRVWWTWILYTACQLTGLPRWD